MPFVPNAAGVTYPPQAVVDQYDLDILAAGSAGTGALVYGGGEGLAIAQLGSPGMAVQVSAGFVSIAGSLPIFAPGSASLAIGANASGSDRLDLVVVSATGVVSVVAGTPAGLPYGPVFPLVTPTTQAVIGAVYVPNGAASILTANIIDKRVVVGLTYPQKSTDQLLDSMTDGGCFGDGIYNLTGAMSSITATTTLTLTTGNFIKVTTTTTAATTITQVGTAVTVTSVTGFNTAGGTVLIGGLFATYTGVSGSTLTGVTIANGSFPVTAGMVVTTVGAAAVGMIVEVGGAGPSGTNLFSTITAITSNTTVTLNNAASTTVSSTGVLYGHDDTAALRMMAARGGWWWLAANPANGLLATRYLVTGGLVMYNSGTNWFAFGGSGNVDTGNVTADRGVMITYCANGMTVPLSQSVIVTVSPFVGTGTARPAIKGIGLHDVTLDCAGNCAAGLAVFSAQGDSVFERIYVRNPCFTAYIGSSVSGVLGEATDTTKTRWSQIACRNLDSTNVMTTLNGAQSSASASLTVAANSLPTAGVITVAYSAVPANGVQVAAYTPFTFLYTGGGGTTTLTGVSLISGPSGSPTIPSGAVITYAGAAIAAGSNNVLAIVQTAVASNGSIVTTSSSTTITTNQTLTGIFPASGSLSIGGTICTYTGISGTTITGVNASVGSITLYTGLAIAVAGFTLNCATGSIAATSNAQFSAGGGAVLVYAYESQATTTLGPTIPLWVTYTGTTASTLTGCNFGDGWDNYAGWNTSGMLATNQLVVPASPVFALGMILDGNQSASSPLGNFSENVMDDIALLHANGCALKVLNADSFDITRLVANRVSTGTGVGVEINGSNINSGYTGRNIRFRGGSAGAGGVTVRQTTIANGAIDNAWWDYEQGNGEPAPNIEPGNNFWYTANGLNGGAATTPAGNLPAAHMLSAFTTTTSVLAVPPGWAFSVQANEIWTIEALLVVSCSTTTSTGGCRIGITAPAGATVFLEGIGQAGGATIAQVNTSATGGTGAQGLCQTTVPTGIMVKATVVNGATAGQAGVMIGSVLTTATVTFTVTSHFRAYKVS